MQWTARQSLCIPTRDPENRDGSVHNTEIEGGSSEKREEAGATGKFFKQAEEAWGKGHYTFSF